MSNSKSSKRLSTLIKEIVNPLQPNKEEQVHGQVAEQSSSRGQFNSISAMQLSSVSIPEIITSFYTDPKDIQDHHNIVPRKPAPGFYLTSETRPFQPDDLGLDRHSPHRLQKRAASNPPRSLPSSLSPQWSPAASPEASPATAPIRSSHRSSSSSPNIPNLGLQPTYALVSSARPNSYHSDAGGYDGGKTSKRRSWLPMVRSRAASEDTTQKYAPRAWVLGARQLREYNLEPLIYGAKIPELWNENGDFYVYLFPQSSRPPPSFKLSSRLISSSPTLMGMAFEDLRTGRRRARSYDNRNSLSAADNFRGIHVSDPDSPPYTSKDFLVEYPNPSDELGESTNSFGSALPRVGHLYFPMLGNDAGQTGEQVTSKREDHLVAARNFFAFLTGQPLLATRRNSTHFDVFDSIARQLKSFRFGNADGSTYGEMASRAFDFYVDDLCLGDVRNSEEKNIQAIILGESMRSTKLFNESYVHAVSRCTTLQNQYPRQYSMISENTRHRLERASLDLEKYQESVLLRLSDCEFPALFVGAASSSSEDNKIVRFRAWKTHFGNFRKHFLSYYRDIYGSWPPKGSSKKNSFQGPGLQNRLILRKIYKDLCSLYDILVNRTLLTTRSMDIDDVVSDGDPAVAALRRVLTEYDRSSPPVQPPVPFDVPLLPTIATIAPNHYNYSLKDRQINETRKLKEYETLLVLAKSHNMGSVVATPFVNDYFELERKEALGKTVRELEDQRFGYWLFIYAVLQALPMLVVDAPNLRYEGGVDYFLSMPPSGSPPWIKESKAPRRSWYGVTGSSGVVSLPSDVVNHGVEGTYLRSHCWVVAEQWLNDLHPPDSAAALPKTTVEYYETAVVKPEYEGESRSSSRGIEIVDHRRQASNSSTSTNPQIRHPSHERPRSRSISKHRQSVAFGLQQLPVPYGYDMSTGSRHNSRPASDTGSPPMEANASRRSNDYGMPVGLGPLSPEDLDYTNRRGFDDILTDLGTDRERESRWSRW